MQNKNKIYWIIGIVIVALIVLGLILANRTKPAPGAIELTGEQKDKIIEGLGGAGLNSSNLSNRELQGALNKLADPNQNLPLSEEERGELLKALQ